MASNRNEHLQQYLLAAARTQHLSTTREVAPHSGEEHDLDLLDEPDSSDTELPSRQRLTMHLSEFLARNLKGDAATDENEDEDPTKSKASDRLDALKDRHTTLRNMRQKRFRRQTARLSKTRLSLTKGGGLAAAATAARLKHGVKDESEDGGGNMSDWLMMKDFAKKQELTEDEELNACEKNRTRFLRPSSMSMNVRMLRLQATFDAWKFHNKEILKDPKSTGESAPEGRSSTCPADQHQTLGGGSSSPPSRLNRLEFLSAPRRIRAKHVPEARVPTSPLRRPATTSPRNRTRQSQGSPGQNDKSPRPPTAPVCSKSSSSPRAVETTWRSVRAVRSPALSKEFKSIYRRPQTGDVFRNEIAAVLRNGVESSPTSSPSSQQYPGSPSALAPGHEWKLRTVFYRPSKLLVNGVWA